MSRVRRLLAAVAIGVALLAVPSGTTASTTYSLVAIESASAVDFGEGVVWVLALGSDSKTGDPLDRSARADAIELIALEPRTGRAVALGIARDSWVDIDGEGFGRINGALGAGGPELVAAEVASLTGITPHYVLTAGFAGFEALVDTVGVLEVRTDVDIDDPEHGLELPAGVHQLDGATATALARSRSLEGDDFGRQANQQRLLEAILVKLRAEQDAEGFLERGALAALRHLETDLSPSELYRFAQAVTLIDPRKTTACVLPGDPDTINEAQIIYLDETVAKRLAADAADDARLRGGCG